MNTTAEQKLLSISEIAAKFRVQPATVIQLVKAKRLKAFRFGRLWRVDADSLQEYINSTTINA